MSTPNALPVVAWLIDPGMGSALDRIQRTKPSTEQLSDMALRGGNASELCKVSDALAAIDAASAESDAVIATLIQWLAQIAIALKGKELPLQSHSYHDLPELVEKLKIECEVSRQLAASAVQPPKETI